MFIIYKGFSSIYKFIDNFPFQKEIKTCSTYLCRQVLRGKTLRPGAERPKPPLRLPAGTSERRARRCGKSVPLNAGGAEG